MEIEGIWSEQFRIQAFMVNENRQLTLPMLCNLLQETAGNHANFHQLGFFEMQAQNRFWVLNRLKITLYEKVHWQETITIQTWVSLMRGPFSHRNFSILNEQGTEIASAFTLWVALDASSRKPVRVEPKDLPVFKTKLATCGAASKIPAIDNPGQTFHYRVKNSDLDMIGHVNNVKYIEWVLDTYISADKLSEIQSLEVNYLNETGPNEKIQILKNVNSEGDLFSICTEQKGREVCRMSIAM